MDYTRIDLGCKGCIEDRLGCDLVCLGGICKFLQICELLEIQCLVCYGAYLDKIGDSG